MTTAAEVAAYFADWDVNPAWNSGTAKLVDGVWTYSGAGETADVDARMQSIADRLNSGTLDWTSLDNSIVHILQSGGSTHPNGVTTSTGVVPGTTTTTTGPGFTKTARDYMDAVLAFFPQMPREFVDAAAQAWAANADYGMDVAIATLRQDARYEGWFPGNKAPDGTVHLAEGQYWLTRRQYADVLTQIGVNPNVFNDGQYVDLIKGDVDVVEWQSRIRELSNNILSTAEDYGLRGYYAELYNIPTVSDGAILESAFAGNADAIRRQVGQALVGYEGEIRGFDIQLQLASSLYDANIRTQGQASELFGDAAAQVPLFGRLAERHFDPDDDYDLGEYIQAAVFDDQEQLTRMNRLLSQERAQFSAYRPLRERNGLAVGLVAE
jgi:hypothetical protein